mmetsp:Transcript_74875/g.121661  ORF Transcript_74875/g.121661 Transcript_74875/m.121661 type:complete len:223 (+) Transcript_74875:1822-2490(+)
MLWTNPVCVYNPVSCTTMTITANKLNAGATLVLSISIVSSPISDVSSPPNSMPPSSVMKNCTVEFPCEPGATTKKIVPSASNVGSCKNNASFETCWTTNVISCIKSSSMAPFEMSATTFSWYVSGYANEAIWIVLAGRLKDGALFTDSTESLADLEKLLRSSIPTPPLSNSVKVKSTVPLTRGAGANVNLPSRSICGSWEKNSSGAKSVPASTTAVSTKVRF